MSLLRGFLALGAVLSLATLGAAAPSKGAKGNPQTRQAASAKAGKSHRYQRTLGIVVHVHYNPRHPHTGSLTIRLGDGHYHRLAASIRHRLREHRHHRTETFTVDDDTRFARLDADARSGNRQRRTGFNDLRPGERVKILGQTVARLVDILEDHRHDHKFQGTGSASGSGSGSWNKTPLRHPLVDGRKALRYLDRWTDRLAARLNRNGLPGLARRLDRIEDRLERNRGRGLARRLDRIEDRREDRREVRREYRQHVRRVLARRALTDARKVVRFVRRQVVPQVERLVDRHREHRTEKKAAGSPATTLAKTTAPAPTHGAKTVAINHIPAKTTPAPNPPIHKAASTHHATSAHHAATGHHRH